MPVRSAILLRKLYCTPTPANGVNLPHVLNAVPAVSSPVLKVKEKLLLTGFLIVALFSFVTTNELFFAGLPVSNRKLFLLESEAALSVGVNNCSTGASGIVLFTNSFCFGSSFSVCKRVNVFCFGFVGSTSVVIIFPGSISGLIERLLC